MDYTALSSRKKALIISGSLLLHLLLLILMFIAITGENPFDSSRHIDELATILAQSPMQSEDATVIFYDEPSTQVGSTVSTEPMSQQADTPFDAYAKAEEEKPVNEEIITGEIEQPIFPVRSSGLVEKELKISQKTVTPVRPEPVEGNERRQSSGIGNITMADIAKGFLKSMAQESGGKPTSMNGEQLARQRYNTRVWSVLRQSYNSYITATQLLNDVHTYCVFILTIDKTGKIISAELQHPKKTLDIIQFERVFLRAVRTSGLFPPIPKQFNADTITLNFPVMLHGQTGTNYLRLVYGDREW